jgi:hypothetical protein
MRIKSELWGVSLRQIFTSRFTKLLLMLTAMLVGPCLFVASADTITTFNVTGTFSNGATLAGTITINTTFGTITGASLVAGASEFSFADLVISMPFAFPFGHEFLAQFVTSPFVASPGSLSLFIPGDSLIGYTGGALCSNSVPCLESSGGVGASLTSGSLSVAAVPEPSELILLSAGLIGLGFVARKYSLASGRT